jgi:hypothetical protein
MINRPTELEMKLTVNKKEVDSTNLPGVKTLGTFISSLFNASIIAEDDLVASIVIDGRTVDALEEDLDVIPLDLHDTKEIKIKTEPVQSVLLTAMHDGRESCALLVEDCKTAADKFRDINVAAAAEYFSSLSDKIMDTMQYLGELNHYIQSFYGPRKDENFIKIREHFQVILKEAISHQEDADWVMLADLLEYEFTEVFSSFSAYLESAEGFAATKRPQTKKSR